MPLEIPVIVAALVALDVLAYWFGHDSRETWLGEWRPIRRFWWQPEEEA